MNANAAVRYQRDGLKNLIATSDFKIPERPPKPPVRLRRRRGDVYRKLKFPWDLELKKYLADPLARTYEFATPADVPRLKREAKGWRLYYDFWEAVDGTIGSAYSRFLQPERIPPLFADIEKLKIALPWGFTSSFSNPHQSAAHLASMIARHYATSFFGYAVPNWPTMNAIAELDMPVLDLGSGRGFWAWSLERLGVRVLCEEPDPREWYWRAPDRTTATRRLPRDHALLFCWPTYGDAWAYHRLLEYRGDTVIYVGEGEGGCTADTKFHGELERSYRTAKEIMLPQWDGIHDSLTIYKREKWSR